MNDILHIGTLQVNHQGFSKTKFGHLMMDPAVSRIQQMKQLKFTIRTRKAYIQTLICIPGLELTRRGWFNYIFNNTQIHERLSPIYSFKVTNQLYHMMFSFSFNATALCIQYIPRNMHTVFALLCFVVVIHWRIFPYPSGLLHWHCGNLTIAPVPAKQPWWIWINISYEFIMNDCITTTKQSTTKPCAYFLGYTVVCL